MIDLHTHLLPDWDDGAADWEEMFRMARVADRDGIKKVVLTPHIYRLSKYGDDLKVLEERIAQFQEKAARFPIEFYRGAEVFVHQDMVECIKKNNLTINNSNYVFVEFPSESILPGVRDLFYQMMLGELIPIISHPERNMVFAKRPDLLYDLVSMGALAQVTAKSISGEFGHETKEIAQVFLVNNLVHLIASDAHDSEKRPPKLSRAVEKARKIVGEEKALAMVTSIPQAILDNQEIPDYGDPINPVGKKKWTIKI